MLGVFQGLTFVVTISFFVMLPIAAITCVVWPTIQNGIESVQHFIIDLVILVFGCIIS